MEPYELTTCSFIVKVWIEESKAEAGQVIWRGHITHVSSGDRQYFEDLGQIILFMIPFLESIGIDLATGSAADQ
jgi:hypothetical protein